MCVEGKDFETGLVISIGLFFLKSNKLRSHCSTECNSKVTIHSMANYTMVGVNTVS